MSQKKFHIIDLSHHAYLLISSATIDSDLIDYLEKGFSIKVLGNPDFLHKSYEVLNIDDAREIIRFHNIIPVDDKNKKIIILSFDSITLEAQNAFLKTLEEPAPYVHFFLITNKISALIDTIQSRVNVIFFDHSIDEAMLKLAKDFIKKKVKDRLEFAKDLVEEINKEKKNKKYVSDFIDAILFILRQEGVIANQEKIRSVELANKYLEDRSPSVKMLLEYIALTL